MADKTYADEQNRNRSKHNQRKEDRNHLWRARGISAEDVVDLLLLAIADGLLVGWEGDIGVLL